MVSGALGLLKSIRCNVKSPGFFPFSCPVIIFRIFLFILYRNPLPEPRVPLAPRGLPSDKGEL
uniref:Uncharacterized protein n=1 Tax=Utricularia reniformis TaxID=192314 RepID=A0A1Y0B0U1_9LAMI|nr:hypothetical protein AEK19_MT0751 [Utricularia reniformis]ART30994.1 hypothetical protein AEK19_MT0751 [Utricularia reniformis]